jgi:multiple sugar transport system substrate-binding protein
MLSAPAQKEAAIGASWTPTLKSVYDDADVKQKQPLFTKLAPILQNAVPRPVSPVYPDLSNLIQSHIHQALLKQVSPQAALSALQSDLQALVSK